MARLKTGLSAPTPHCLHGVLAVSGISPLSLAQTTLQAQDPEFQVKYIRPDNYRDNNSRQVRLKR